MPKAFKKAEKFQKINRGLIQPGHTRAGACTAKGKCPHGKPGKSRGR